MLDNITDAAGGLTSVLRYAQYGGDIDESYNLLGMAAITGNHDAAAVIGVGLIQSMTSLVVDAVAQGATKHGVHGILSATADDSGVDFAPVQAAFDTLFDTITEASA